MVMMSGRMWFLPQLTEKATSSQVSLICPAASFTSWTSGFTSQSVITATCKAHTAMAAVVV